MKEIKTLRDFIQKSENIHSECNIPLLSYWNKDRTSLLEIEAKTFYQNVKRLGSWFINKDISNSKIAIISENSYEALLTFFAVTCSGNIAVMIDYNLNNDEINELIEFNDCDVICYSKFLKEKTLCLNSKLQAYDINDLCAYIEDSGVVTDETKYNEVIISVNTPATIIFTSGTSGTRKGVVLSHYNLVANTDKIGKKIIQKDSIILPLPFYHIFSLAAAIMALNRKQTLFIENNIRHISKDIVVVKPRIVICVPALLPYIYNGYSTISKNGSCYTVCGGAGGAESWVEKFKDIDVKLLFGYGMSETAGPICFDEESDKAHLGYMDILEGNNITLDNPNEDDIGEVVCEGPGIMQEYYKMKEETDAVLKNGKLYTGDLGKFDKEGRLRIVGRKKNLIILPNGENIAPEIIERKILQIKGIKECLVSMEEGKLQANIFTNDDHCEIEKAIQELNLKLNSHMRIMRIVFVDKEFEKNSNGKTIRN